MTTSLPPTWVPLSNLVPTWRGTASFKDYCALETELRLQRSRFRNDRYLVFSFVSELDYDSLRDHLHFDAGFNQPEEAAVACSRVVKQRMLGARIRHGSMTDHWHKEAFADIKIMRPIDSRVDLLAAKELNDGTGWKGIMVYAGVLEMTPGDPLSAADLNALGRDYQVIGSLRHEWAL